MDDPTQAIIKCYFLKYLTVDFQLISDFLDICLQLDSLDPSLFYPSISNFLSIFDVWVWFLSSFDSSQSGLNLCLVVGCCCQLIVNDFQIVVTWVWWCFVRFYIVTATYIEFSVLCEFCGNFVKYSPSFCGKSVCRVSCWFLYISIGCHYASSNIE